MAIGEHSFLLEMLIFQVKSEIVHCLIYNVCDDTVDGRNPAPVDMVDYPMIYMVLYIPGGAGCLPSRVLFRMSLMIIDQIHPRRNPNSQLNTRNYKLLQWTHSNWNNRPFDKKRNFWDGWQGFDKQDI